MKFALLEVVKVAAEIAAATALFLYAVLSDDSKVDPDEEA